MVKNVSNHPQLQQLNQYAKDTMKRVDEKGAEYLTNNPNQVAKMKEIGNIGKTQVKNFFDKGKGLLQNSSMSSVFNDINKPKSELTMSGGAIRKMNLQTKRVSSRILKSLKCFKNTDNIKSNKCKSNKRSLRRKRHTIKRRR